MGSDNAFQAVWEATNELRFQPRLVKSEREVSGGRVARILQQKWRDQYGNTEWRDVPEVTE